MRTLFLVPLVLTLSGCDLDDGNWGSSDRFKADLHEARPLAPGGRLTVENVNGGVEILAWEKNEVDVNATKYASTQEQLDKLKVEITASGNTVSIRTVRQGNSDFWRNGGGVKYVLRVPQKVELERIQTTNGGIRAERTIGPASLKSTNGTIRVLQVEGRVRVETTNGNVEFTSVTGDVQAHSTNGTIRGENVKGAFEAETTNGGVRATLSDPAAGRPIRAHTTNGGIDLDVAKLNGNEIRCETSNGGITLHLPADARATLRARTSHSSVMSDFPVTIEKHRADGPIGGGGPVIDLSTSNGGIKLLKK